MARRSVLSSAVLCSAVLTLFKAHPVVWPLPIYSDENQVEIWLCELIVEHLTIEDETLHLGFVLWDSEPQWEMRTYRL